MNTEHDKKQQVEESAVPIGGILKRARKKMGLSIQDVADRLKLRIAVIQEIEENTYENIPCSTFTRGYIRSYSKFLGLNSDEILGTLKSASSPLNEEQKMQSFSRKTRREKDDSRVMGLTWFIFAIVVSLTAFWWWQNEPGQVPLKTGITNIESTIESPIENDLIQDSDLVLFEKLEDVHLNSTQNESDALLVPEILFEEENEKLVDEIETINKDEPRLFLLPVRSDENTTQTDQQIDEKELKALTPPVPFVHTLSQDEDTPSKASPSSLSSLALSFFGDCWIEVHDATGKRLDIGLKIAGEKVALRGLAPFSVVLGTTDVVDIVFEGEAFDLSGYPSGRVVRLSLP